MRLNDGDLYELTCPQAQTQTNSLRYKRYERTIASGEIVKKERRSIMTTLWRSLRLRCPVCGLTSIVRRPFKIRHHCPTCDALFMREEGFFVGAILINVVTTEIVIVSIYLICLVAKGADYRIVLPILFIAALTFPLAFYHHSWSIWLGIDHVVESLPKNAKQGSPPAKNDEEWPDRIDA